MSHRTLGIRHWAVLVVVAVALAIGGIAIAQEGDTTPSDTDNEEDLGPRWQRDDAEGWTPGSGGPPPWAGQGDDDDDEDDGDEKGPRWQREDAGDWQPGHKGPPPWSNARWQRDDAEGWTPGSGGPPPWAGKGNDDE